MSKETGKTIGEVITEMTSHPTKTISISTGSNFRITLGELLKKAFAQKAGA